MNKKQLNKNQSSLLLIGAIGLIITRFFEKDLVDWNSIDYYILIVCGGTIVFSILTLVRKK